MKALRPEDFATDQDVRWCPGCGDYAILKAVQKTLAELEANPEKVVFISGIGCSSRFPYYMATYGFHTIHGRAPAVATGLKMQNPELDVWVITGDGDGLSIGGNHLYHLLRRDVDLQILLFNNEIYGLTKGQYSPTSRTGMITPSSPDGSRDRCVLPCRFAAGSGATFIACAIDVDQRGLVTTLKRAKAHKGTSFVEILQNCHVFNDGAFAALTSKKTGADHVLALEHGAPMLFGVERDRGLAFNRSRLTLEIVLLAGRSPQEADILVHDETNPALACLLTSLPREGFPTLTGVIYAQKAASNDSATPPAAFQRRGAALDAVEGLLHAGQCWQIE